MITEAAARMPAATRLIGCDCTVAEFSFAVGPPGVGRGALEPESGRAAPQLVKRAFRWVRYPGGISRCRRVDGIGREISVRLRTDRVGVHLPGQEKPAAVA
ncbi:hypothetical protein [Amycolatopsis sp. lyj-346]|uniref:hypothetical protein n=1 Tax=Amycolatopsis sp. lyj-346 TaxID=2789289 RepID=UPI00397DF254